MPGRDITTLADKIALTDKIKNKQPNTSHRQMPDINGVLKQLSTLQS
jgi:hypothetical protein